MRTNIQTTTLSFILIFSTTILFGQVEDLSLMAGNWNQGTLENDKVIKLGPRRGGSSSITFNKDSSLIYSGSFDCGFGAKRIGTWSFKTSQNTITFKYDEIIGYLNNPEPTLHNQIETYKIKRLNSVELILTGIRNDLPFDLYFTRK